MIEQNKKCQQTDDHAADDSGPSPAAYGKNLRGLCLVFVYTEHLCQNETIKVKLTPSHSYGVSLAIWDHTVSPSTRHK